MVSLVNYTISGAMGLDANLTEEIERFSKLDAHGDVVVVNNGELLYPGDNPDLRVALSAQEQTAARMALQAILDGIKDDHGVHCESAVGLVGGVIGRAIFLEYQSSWEAIDEKYTAIYIEDVSRELYRTVGFIESALAQKDPDALILAPEIPDDHRPGKIVAGSIVPAHKDMEKIVTMNGVTQEKRRWTLAYALILLLGMTRGVMPQGLGLRIALRWMVRAAKTPAAHLAELRD